jgi:hypothetical protein
LSEILCVGAGTCEPITRSQLPTGWSKLSVMWKFAKWLAFAAIAACGSVFVLLVLGLGGYPSPFPTTEVTDRKPYADFIGQEFRVADGVRATAWNDFPDKAKILSITLDPTPGVRNRFVSYVTPLQEGQRIRIVSAWRRFALFGFDRDYFVTVPGAGLLDGVPVKLRMNADGNPDPRVVKPINQ